MLVYCILFFVIVIDSLVFVFPCVLAADNVYGHGEMPLVAQLCMAINTCSISM